MRRAIALLAVIGTGIAGYLLAARIVDTAPVCTSGGCEVVQSSEYAEIFGVPVAALGVTGYLGILATTLRATYLAAFAAAVLAFGGSAFAVYLVVIQIAVIDALCIWCLASDGVMVAIAALAIFRLRSAG